VLLACALAVGLRAPLIAIIKSQATSDSLFYVLSARSIAEGHGYGIFGHPTAFFPVGWPAFIALLFRITGSYSFANVLWAGAGLWALSSALMYVFALRLGGRAAAAVAACLVAAYPDFLFYSLRAVSETLFIPLLIGACIALTPSKGRQLTWWASLIAGMLFGAAILVRTTAAQAPFAVAVLLLLAGRDLRALRNAAVFLAVTYLMVVPWVARNEAVMKTLALSTNAGYTLWLGDNPRATGGNELVGPGRTHWQIATAAEEVADNRERMKEPLEFMVHDPPQWLALVPDKARYLFLWNPAGLVRATDAAAASPQQSPTPRVLGAEERDLIDFLRRLFPALRVGHLLYWVCGAAALVAAIVWRRPGAALVAVLVGLWIILHVTVAHGQFRYMLSVQPLMAAPLAWGLTAPLVCLWRRLGGRRTAVRAACGAPSSPAASGEVVDDVRVAGEGGEEPGTLPELEVDEVEPRSHDARDEGPGV
jgi:4-amino-4-deoxy-L-arabinose transferase-like glycosyltransferase